MRALPRLPWDLVLLGAASFGITLVWIQHSGAPGLADALAPAALPPAPISAPEPEVPPPTQAAPVVPAPEIDIDAQLAAATGDFAENRLAAIMALADAPRARALPVLLRIAKRSSVVADRHAALDSLFAQGLQQRDADDPIPDLLRDLIYDGNDEEISEHAARVLDQLNSTGPA